MWLHFGAGVCLSPCYLYEQYERGGMCVCVIVSPATRFLSFKTERLSWHVLFPDLCLPNNQVFAPAVRILDY